MNRSLFALPLAALFAAMSIITGLAITIASPAVADAQDSTSASLSLNVSESSADQTFRTVAVALDPGLSGLAALGGSLTFDPANVTVSSCALSEVGACNVIDGEVLFSVFNLARLPANEQLMTINFEPTTASAANTVFAVAATTAVNNRGEAIGAVAGNSIDVQIFTPTYGSLTGSVVQAATTAGIYALDVCVVSDSSGAETCTTTTGLGTWRIDELATGTYAVVVNDSTDTYDGVVLSGFVREDEVSVVEDAVLEYFTDQTTEEAAEETTDETTEESGQDGEDVSVTDPVPSENIPAGAIVPTAPIEVTYGASISGRITGLRTEVAIEAAQVCATQPLVLHQSCATTDANGAFTLTGLSAGNYWVEVVDALGQSEQTRPRLVGVVGDNVARTGVNINLAAIAG